MANLIYQPKGKAREYSPWACNLYNGCTNECDYCYNRHSLAANILGKREPTLKSGATFDRFVKELSKTRRNILQDGKGLFFNFVSDPFLPETWELNTRCAEYAMANGVPCVFLSKRVPNREAVERLLPYKDMLKIGFTLTGCDFLEPHADLSIKRIAAMERLEELGIKTWASIEPVIDIPRSMDMIKRAHDAGCRNFKIGLLSGKRTYTPQEVLTLKSSVDLVFSDCEIYWKDSVFEYIKNL